MSEIDQIGEAIVQLNDENRTLKEGLRGAKAIIAVLVERYGSHGLLRVDVNSINGISRVDRVNIFTDNVNNEVILSYNKSDKDN